MAAPFGNKFALGANSGRPAHYKTPGKLSAAVHAYFNWCIKNEIKPTVTGLTLYLGFCSRASLDDYEKRGDEFSYIIKRAKLAVENSYELSGQTIDIFALKNMGWQDKQTSELTGKDGSNLYPGGTIDIDKLSPEALLSLYEAIKKDGEG